MNILMIGELYRYGGASEIMELLSHKLKECGHNVVSIYGYNHSDIHIEKDVIVLYNKKNRFIYRMHRYLSFFLDLFFLPNLPVRYRIRKIIKENKIDIVHFHAMQNNFLSLCDISYLAKKYKTIFTIHDTWLFTGGCMYFKNCLKWQNTECNNCIENRKFIYSVIKNTRKNYLQKRKVFLNKNISFITPSIWMENLVKLSYLRNENVQTINNGIDIDIFTPLKNRNELRLKYGITKKTIMFSAGDINNPYKGFDLLIKALNLLDSPDEYQLLIIGKISNLIENVNISVVYTGYLTDKTLLNMYYNLADLFILPSREDNFPTVVLEAMASGTPVLAFNIGGLPEEISENGGWIEKSLTSYALKEQIEKIFSDTAKNEKLIKQREFVSEYCRKTFNSNKMAKKYIKIYKEKMEIVNE